MLTGIRRTVSPVVEVILSVDPLDTPTGRFMTGLAAAWFKSAVCASVIQAPTTFARTYRWPHASRETR